jgi:glycosyltransferase involved in cell wall biosynthesis
MSSQPLSILVVINDLGRGGAERQIFELVTRLDRQCFRPSVATFVPDVEYRDRLREAGVDLFILNKSGWREATLPMRLANVMRRVKADVVHAYLFPASWRSVLAGRLADVRNVICAVRSTSVWMNSRHRMMNRLALRRARAVVANAPALREDVARTTGLPADAVKVIMNGVDTGEYSPGESSARLEWMGEGSAGIPLIGFVGSLRTAKDPLHFVRIAARVIARRPDARFVVVGEGSLYDRVKREARESGLNEKLTMAGMRTEMADVFRGLDALVVTSRREGCCNAILEAMSTGVPVAATSVGGNPDLVRDGVTGRLFEHGDDEVGAECVLDLLGSVDRTREMRKAARAIALECYSIDTMVKATTALYREIA